MASPRIQVLIDGSAEGLQRAVAKARKQLGDLEEKLDNVGSKKSRFGQLGDAASNLAGQHLGPLGDAADALGADLDGMSTKGLVAGAAVAALGTAAVASVKSYLELTDRVRSFRDASGLTTEEASRLLAVMDDLGVNTDTAAGAMTRFARNIDAGKLAEYNIEVERNADGTVNMAGTLGNVADVMSRVDDPTRRAAIGTELLGKSYSELSPLLQLGKDGMKEWTDSVSDAQVITDQNLKDSRDFSLAMDSLTESATDVGLAFGKDVVPVLANTANGIVSVIDKLKEFDDWVDSRDSFAKQMDAEGYKRHSILLNVASKETKKAVESTKGLMDIAGAPADALRKSTAELKKEQERQAEAARDQAEAERERAAATREAQRANESAANAIEAERNALLGLFSQELGAERSRKAFTKSTEELANATDDYDEKLAATKESALSNAAAQVALAKQTAESKGAGYDAAAAQRDFRGALIEMRDAAGDDNLRQYLDDRIAQLDAAEAAGYRAGGGLAFAAQKAREFAIESGANVIPGFGIATPADRVARNADGGNVRGGVPTLVGESGPEMFVPQGNGRILSADDLARVGGTGGQGVTINVMTPIGEPTAVVRWLREELRKLDRGQR